MKHKLTTSRKKNNPHAPRNLPLFLGLICLLTIIFFSPPCKAGIKVLTISPHDQKVELGPFIQILEDSTKALDITDVSQPPFSDKFFDNQSSSINRGTTDTSHWFRFSIANTNNNQTYKEVGHRPGITERLLCLKRDLDDFDTIKIFWKQAGEGQGVSLSKWQTETYGKYHAKKSGKREPPCIRIALPLDTRQPATFYMQIEMKSGLFFEPVLYSTDAYINFSKKLCIFYGVYYGLVISMIIYNLFHFFFLREKVRLIFIMYATTLATYFFVVNELSLSIIPTSYLMEIRKITQFLLLLSFAQGLYFTIVFLDAKRTVPLLYRLLQIVALISICLILALPFVSYFSMLKILPDFSKLNVLVIMSAGVLAWFRGYQPARFFLLAWFFYLGGGTIYALNFQGLFPYAFIGAKAFQAGSGIEMVLLSLAIADRIKFLFERLNKAQKRRQKQLHTLTDQLIQAEERERRRIAGVLHDSIGQTLVATKWEVRRLLKSCPPSIADDSMALSNLDTCIHETRALTTELYPRALYVSGLEDALQSLTKDFSKKSDVMMKISTKNDLEMISEGLRFILYRSVSELLNNVVKHANANHAEISLLVEDGKVSVSVQDDGIGFDYSTIQNRDTTGFGLFSIQERLHRIGGTLKVEMVAAGGSMVTISAPLKDR